MRKRMVTRTIKSTQVTALCLNVITAEPHNVDFIVPANIKAGEQTLKYLREQYDTETDKVVSIVNNVSKEQLYTMSEEDFIKYASTVSEYPEIDNED